MLPICPWCKTAKSVSKEKYRRRYFCAGCRQSFDDSDDDVRDYARRIRREEERR